MNREDVIAKAQRPEKCEWKQDDDGSWDTDCGNKFCIESGTPRDNGMLFCCYCGAALVVEDASHCMCDACKEGVLHYSDCAVHNWPAYTLGKCDCGVTPNLK